MAKAQVPVIGLDQNYLVHLAKAAIALHAGRSAPQHWRRALEAVHAAAQVRRVVVFPVSPFTRDESRTGRDVMARNEQIGQELCGGLAYKLLGLTLDYQIAFELTRIRGKDADARFGAPKGARDARLYLDHTARTTYTDPHLKNLCFRVDWAARKGAHDPDPAAVLLKSRLARVALDEVRLIMTPKARAESFVREYLASGLAFWKAFRCWYGEQDHPFGVLPDDTEVRLRMVETYRELYRGHAFEILPEIQGPADRWRQPNIRDVDVEFVRLMEEGKLAGIPPAEIYGRLMGVLARERQRNPDANDVYDILRAATMVPAAVAYATDAAMKSRLEQSGVAADYNVQVFGAKASDVESFADYVSSMRI